MISKLEELEKSVAALPKNEMDQFADWLDGLRASQWDAQIEIDSESDALEELLKSALSGHASGHTTSL